MGVEYSAKIVVGLPVEEMRDLRDDNGYWDEEGALEFVPDSYDSSTGIVGIEIEGSGDYSYREIDLEEILVTTSMAQDSFKEITGKEAKVYLCTNGH